MTDEVETETWLSRDEIATYLGQLSAEFDAGGDVRLAIGDEVVSASPPDQCGFEVEYEREDDETAIEIEIGWPTAESDGDDTAMEAPVDGEDSLAGEASADEGDPLAEEAASTIDADSGSSAADSGARPADSGAGADDSDVESDAPTPADGVPVSAESRARFELFEDRAGEWRWRLVHRNGNVIATSGEGYTRKANAEKGMRSVKRNAQGAPAVGGE